MTLVGDPSLVRSKISLKAMLRTIRKEKQGFVVEIKWLEVKEDTGKVKNQAGVPEFLQGVIQEYDDVFKGKAGLPPSRGHEHSIHLKEGSNPVGARPYRYP